MTKELLVVDYTGTSRSGKGTITKHIEASNPGKVTRLETGVDYRRVAHTLLQRDIIMVDMPIDVQLAAIDELGAGGVSELLQEAQPDQNDLYTSLINEVVSDIAGNGAVRGAVKHKFKERAEAIRDGDRFEIALTDGRNLASLLRNIPRVSVLLGNFVTCSPLEMKLRECTRLDIDPESDEAEKITDILLESDKRDARRSIDPVASEAEAIDYWAFPDIDESIVQGGSGFPYSTRYEEAVLEARELYPATRLGIGGCATNTRRQVYFDTTRFSYSADPVRAMSLGAEIVFLEAVLSHTGEC